MKTKTAHLGDTEAEWLATKARQEGCSQSSVIRSAIQLYRALTEAQEGTTNG